MLRCPHRYMHSVHPPSPPSIMMNIVPPIVPPVSPINRGRWDRNNRNRCRSWRRLNIGSRRWWRYRGSRRLRTRPQRRQSQEECEVPHLAVPALPNLCNPTRQTIPIPRHSCIPIRRTPSPIRMAILPHRRSNSSPIRPSHLHPRTPLIKRVLRNPRCFKRLHPTIRPRFEGRASHPLPNQGSSVIHPRRVWPLPTFHTCLLFIASSTSLKRCCCRVIFAIIPGGTAFGDSSSFESSQPPSAQGSSPCSLSLTESIIHTSFPHGSLYCGEYPTFDHQTPIPKPPSPQVSNTISTQ